MPGPTRLERVLRAPLWLHGAALFLVLLPLVFVLGDGDIWHADEGALLAQVEQLHDTGDWVEPNPDPQLDPENEALPLELAFRGDGGTWAPYHKHAPYVAMAWGAREVFGERGPWLLSVFSTVFAAAAAGVLARRIRPSLAVPALWVAGIATPLFFDSYIVIAHTVGAALAGWIAVAALDALDENASRIRRVVTGSCAFAGAVLLGNVRTEGVLLAVALGLAILFVGWWRRKQPVEMVVGGLLLVAAGVAYVVESVLTDAVWGPGPPPLGFGFVGSSTVVQGRLDSFTTTVLYPSYVRSGAQVLAALGMIAVWGAAVIVRRDPAARSVIRGLLLLAAVFYVLRFGGFGPVPGLLVATPVLAGFVGLDRESWANRDVVRLTIASLVFAAAVLVTQYDSGGSGEWGGRYFAVGLPLAVPPALEGLRSLGRRVDAETRKVALACLGVITAALVVVGVDATNSGQAGGAAIAAVMTEARDDTGTDGPATVLTTDAAVGRFTWSEALEGPWHSVARPTLERYSERLAARGRPIVVFTTEPDEDLPILEQHWTVSSYEGDAVLVLTPK